MDRSVSNKSNHNFVADKKISVISSNLSLLYFSIVVISAASLQPLQMTIIMKRWQKKVGV